MKKIAIMAAVAPLALLALATTPNAAQAAGCIRGAIVGGAGTGTFAIESASEGASTTGKAAGTSGPLAVYSPRRSRNVGGGYGVVSSIPRAPGSGGGADLVWSLRL